MPFWRSSKTGMGCGGSKPIADNYESIEQVQDALKQSGLESSDVAIFVDFTKSNEWSGAKSFGGRSLHSVDAGVPNPYAQVITIVCRTLAAFDDDKIIPTYGFGDAQSRHTGLFSFLPKEQPVHGFENILVAYSNIARAVSLSGGTSFAPAINKAVDLCRQHGGRYHIAIIIADGQVSPECVRDTSDAIVRASHYPLSIIMVGVGDGPWDEMKRFDDQLPKRKFDNFQFVNFTDLMRLAGSNGYSAEKCEAYFAMHALMEVPEQYSFIKKQILGAPAPRGVAVPPQPPVFDPPLPVPPSRSHRATWPLVADSFMAPSHNLMQYKLTKSLKLASTPAPASAVPPRVTVSGPPGLPEGGPASVLI